MPYMLSNYSAAGSARNLLHSYMTPGTTSLQQTQPYYLNQFVVVSQLTTGEPYQ